jgi:hypothetical protein
MLSIMAALGIDPEYLAELADLGIIEPQPVPFATPAKPEPPKIEMTDFLGWS